MDRLEDRGRLPAVALAVACLLGGCGVAPAVDGRGRGTAPAAGPGTPGFEHGPVLEDLRERARGALSDASPPCWGDVAAAAGAIHAASEGLWAERPASVPERDRTQYEGLIVQLKQRSLALQAAADEQSPVGARRALGSVTASCVRCHAIFRPAPRPSPAGG